MTFVHRCSPSSIARTDSCQDGSLAVPEGRDIIPGINQLLHLPFALKIASRDNHPSDHISFVTSHPGKNLFEKVATTHPDVPDRNFEQVCWPVSASQKLLTERSIVCREAREQSL